MIDELARLELRGPALAVDADPAMTLHLALGLPEPAATIATVREETPLDAGTIRRLPEGESVPDYVWEQIETVRAVSHHQLRRLYLDLLPLGHSEGPGCYCHINRALSEVVERIVSGYDLVVVDNEAGLEHLSRYRLKRADLMLVVSGPGRAAQAVAERTLATARRVGMAVERSWLVYNRVPPGFEPPPQPVSDLTPLLIPAGESLPALEAAGQPAIRLSLDDPVRLALRPAAEWVKRCV